LLRKCTRDKLRKEKAGEFLLQLHTTPAVFHLCSITRYIEKNEMGGAGVYRVLVGKPEGKGPHGRPRSRWEVNIYIDIQEVRLRGTDWVDLAEDRESLRALVIEVMNLRVP
jgi:hypothetical protein